MKLRLSLIAGAVVIASILLYKGCSFISSLFPSTDVPVLKDGEKAKAVFSRNAITVVKRGSNRPITHHVPRYSTITVKDDGDVVVSTKRIGLTFEPGIGLGIGADDFRSTFDLKWAYFGRFGAHVGVNGKLKKDMGEINPRFFAGIGHTLPFSWSTNTSFVLAVDHKKDVYGYIRVSF